MCSNYFSPTLCETLNFAEKEKLAVITTEVGHIIHYFNENLTNANNLMIELNERMVLYITRTQVLHPEEWVVTHRRHLSENINLRLM